MDRDNSNSKLKLMFASTLAAILGFLLTATVSEAAHADGSHYEQSDWAANPILWGNSAMYYPLSNHEGAVYYADDPWDNVAEAWLNISVQGNKSLPHSIGASSVPNGEIWLTDYYDSDTNALCTEESARNWVLFKITKARVQCNENNGINWNHHTSDAVAINNPDYLSAIIHEVGHAIGMDHRYISQNGTPDGYGLCAAATSNSTNFFTQATMCEMLVNWAGTGTQYPAGRSLHPHEIVDHGQNY